MDFVRFLGAVVAGFAGICVYRALKNGILHPVKVLLHDMEVVAASIIAFFFLFIVHVHPIWFAVILTVGIVIGLIIRMHIEHMAAQDELKD